MTNTTTRLLTVIALVVGFGVGVVVLRTARSPAEATPSRNVVDVVVHDCPDYRAAQDVRKLLESSFGAAHVHQVSVRTGECLLRVTGEVGRAVADALDHEPIRDRIVDVDDVAADRVDLTLKSAAGPS